MARPSRQVRITRDSILFVAGLLGFIHETLVAEAERPTLLLAFLAMMGLPTFLGRDERKPPE